MMSPKGVWRFEFAGWLLFTLSAIAFCVSAIRSGDHIALIGGVLFLAACLVFLVPVWKLKPK